MDAPGVVRDIVDAGFKLAELLKRLPDPMDREILLQTLVEAIHAQSDQDLAMTDDELIDALKTPWPAMRDRGKH